MRYSVAMQSKSTRRKPRKVSSSKRKFVSKKRKPVKSGVNRFKRYTGKSNGNGIFKNIDKLKLRKFAYIAIGVIFLVGCLSVLTVGIYLKSLQNSLPSPDKLIDRSSDQSTQIFDRNEVLLFTIYGDQNREFIPIDRIPEHTKWALLAAEDIDFYQHKGVDYVSVGVAFFQNVVARKVVRGASTLTQQLVKNTILYDVLGEEAYDKTYTRKIKELLITMQVEQSFTKDEIL
jgi:penicillin-binding protein 1A